MTQLGTGFKTSNLLAPREGNVAMPIDFDFTNVGVIDGDFQKEQEGAVIESIQSIYIDNSQNAGVFQIIVKGLGGQFSHGTMVQAQPFTQGWYPLSVAGVLRYRVITTPGIIIPTIFANYPMAYVVWGPVPGVLVTPPLTSVPLNFAPLSNVADNIIVAAVLGQTVKLYRMLLSFGGGTNVQFFNGPSVAANPLSGVIDMFAGGFLSLQVSGVPWWTTSINLGITMTSSNAVNAGGMEGYVQS